MASDPPSVIGGRLEYAMASASYLGLMFAGVAAILRGADPFAVVPVVVAIAGLSTAGHVSLRRTHADVSRAKDAVLITAEGDELGLADYVQSRFHKVINTVAVARLQAHLDAAETQQLLRELITLLSQPHQGGEQREGQGGGVHHPDRPEE